jgi:hypothetical protein
MSNDWKVLPHRPLEQLEENLWRVEGDLEGMTLKRVMTVARRTDGGVVVHNAIALDEAGMQALSEIGDPAFLIVPNGYHRIDAPRFKARFPDAKVFCPAGARKKVAQVVSVDGAYADFPEDDAVRFEELDGTNGAEGAMIVRSGTRTTLVLNDSMFNMPHQPGFTGWVFKAVTQSSGGPRVSRVFRWFVMKDRAALAAHFERLAELRGLARIVVSHHETVTTDCAGVLRSVAQSLG